MPAKEQELPTLTEKIANLCRLAEEKGYYSNAPEILQKDSLCERARRDVSESVKCLENQLIEWQNNAAIWKKRFEEKPEREMVYKDCYEDACKTAARYFYLWHFNWAVDDFKMAKTSFEEGIETHPWLQKYTDNEIAENGDLGHVE